MNTHVVWRYFYSLAFISILLQPLLAQVRSDSAPLLCKDSIQILPDGDTIFYKPLEYYDFGDILPQNKSVFLDNKVVADTLVIPKLLSVSVDKTKAVGSILYEHGQLPTGGKTYTIPILTVEGNGVVPQIALKYNSQLGNSLAGVGWDLEGLSAIMLSNKVMHYDNEVVAGVINSGNQVFTLNGVRLLPSIKMTEYSLETAQGQILVNPSYSGSVVTSFTARYPNGSIAQFNNNGGDTQEYCFPISNLTDAHGYRIDFEYISSGNRYLISKIKYGGTSASSHPSHIEFRYESRNDIPAFYVGGKEVTLNRILKKIISYNDNAELRTYTLTYSTQGVNLLTQLDCSVSSLSLNPLKFEYGSAYSPPTGSMTKDGDMFLSQYFDSRIPLSYNRGRFQGTTFDDGLVVYPQFPIYDILAQGSGGRIQYGSKYSPDQDLLIAPSLTFFSNVQKIKAESGFQLLAAVDIDGDNIEELVKVNSTASGSYNQLKITTYKYNNASFTASSSTLNLTGIVNAGGLLSPISRSYYFGDFDGDGKVELLTVSHNKTFKNESRSSIFTLIDLQSRSVQTNQNCFSLGRDEDEYVYAMDYDGDGKTDLCRITDAGTEFYIYEKANNTNTFIKKATDRVLTLALVKNRRLGMTDFNGDGKADFIVSPHFSNVYLQYATVEEVDHGCYIGDVMSGTNPVYVDVMNRYSSDRYILYMCANMDGCYRVEDTQQSTEVISHDGGVNWSVYLSKGNGGFALSTFPFVRYKNSGKYIFQDLNMDGYPDVIERNYNGLFVYLNQNGVLSDTPSATLSSITDRNYIVPLNTNQLCATSQFVIIKDATVSSYHFSRNESKERLMTGMTDSYGLHHVNSYAEMTSSSGVYINGSAVTYPYSLFLAPMNLLQQSSIYKDSSKVMDEYYTYYGAVANLQGLGFGGFQKTRVIDYLRNGRTAFVEYDPKRLGVVTKTDSPRQTNTYIYTNMGIGKFDNYQIYSATENDKIRGVTITKAYQYDSYGFPIRETVTWDSGLTSVIDQTYQHKLSGTYLLGSLITRTVTLNRSGNSWIQSEEYGYTTGTLFPTSRIVKMQGKQQEKTEWKYNNGLVTSEKSAPRTLETLLGTTFIYDTKNRYLLSQTDALNRTTTYSEYNLYGLPKNVKNYLNRTTTYTYDSWGRQNTVAHPDTTTTTISYAWETAVGLYSVTQSETNKPTQKVYYDELEREIRTGVECFDGTWRYTDKQYDSYGRLSKESLPFKGTSPTAWNSYAYDAYDRIISFTEASGKVTGYSYSGKSETVIKNGITSTKTYDNSGMLVSTSDPAGTITYTYRPDAQLQSVVAPGGVTTTFEYDADYGYRKKIVDPSAGTMTFTEDYVAGLLVTTQTNANNQKIITKYDTYNRPISKEQPEFTTTYTYDPLTKKLSQETSTNGTSCRYTSDAMGRILTRKEVAGDNVWMQQNYSYAKNAIASVTYSSSKEGNICKERMTYTHGYLTEVKLNNTSIWKLTEENVLGQPTKSVTGPITRTYAYTAYGIPTERKAGSAQHFTYSFDVAKGNLNSRTDKLRSLTENFGYDNLNRLTTYGGKTTTYDTKGNITSMSGIGTMSYTQSNKPYALTGVALTGSQIPTRTQNVTYTSFQRPATITENGYVATFTYNASRQRTKMQVVYNGTTQNNTYYIGGCYETNNNESRLYLAGDYYSSPIVYAKKNGSWEIYYICRDYLGSITHVTNSAGIVQQELSYDAWGRLRNPATQVLYAPGSEPALILGRGYSGHEHLAIFGLINMNARLYDPATGRFLSPDPFVQMIDFTQDFNRYSYCLNNPFVYVDKDGESILLIIGIAAVVGGIVNVATHWDAIKASGSFWKGASYFGVGALAGGLGAVTGVGAAAVIGSLSGVVGGAVIGTASGAVSGFALGGGNALLGGAGWSGFWRGASSGFVSGAISGAAFGSIGGGITSWIQGKNVWTGADIAQGRSAFSLKNNSVDTTPHRPTTTSPDDLSSSAPASQPTPNTSEQTLTPYQKGQQGVDRAIAEFKAEGGTVHMNEVTVELDGIRNRFDFVGELDGKLHLFEVKNGPTARFTPNQAINIPKMQATNPAFIPRGMNALSVPKFESYINMPYPGKYTIKVKIYF